MRFLKKTVCLLAAVCLLLGCFCLPTFAKEAEKTAGEECTGIYVGRKASKDGTTIIARCADTHPVTTSQYLKIEPAVTGKPGRLVSGKNGFLWELPENTYKYISVPRPKAVEKGRNWDSAAMNECGLAVTATVSAYISKEARTWDPYVADGISEDNLAGIIASTCASAREGVERIAKIVDTQGSSESNIIMVADQNEAWYMELYSGHQYAAVKMPEDKIAVFGNEFMLDTLDGYEDVIVSENLEATAQKHGAAVYRNGSFDPFASYVGTENLADYSNLRTWRGHALLAPTTVEAYDTHTKYPLFYDADHKIGDDEIIAVFRDRMEDIIPEEKFAEGKTRIIGTESAAHVHLLKVHSEYPAQMAVEMWLCMSNAAYAPFVPISNAITAADAKYTYVLPEYQLNERSASHVYKKLNALAALNRKQYGLGIESCWQDWEAAQRVQNRAVLQRASELYADGQDAKAAELLTKYSVSVQSDALHGADRMFNELMWYIAEHSESLKYTFSYDTLVFGEPFDTTPFSPGVPLTDYAESYGWSVRQTEDGFVLTRNNDSVTILPSDGDRLSEASATVRGQQIPIDAWTLDGVAYIRHTDAVKHLKTDTVTAADPSVWLKPDSHPWIFFAALGVVLVGGAAILIAGKRKKKAVSDAP